MKTVNDVIHKIESEIQDYYAKGYLRPFATITMTPKLFNWLRYECKDNPRIITSTRKRELFNGYPITISNSALNGFEVSIKELKANQPTEE